MKRVVGIILVLTIVILTAACSKQPAPAQDTPNPDSATEDILKDSSNDPLVDDDMEQEIEDLDDGFAAIEQETSDKGTTAPADPITTPSTPVQEPAQGVTQAELAMHNVKEDCWIAFEGEVYDLTSWLPKHPGGIMMISRWCGTSLEFENAFLKKHGRSKVEILKEQGFSKGALV